MTTSDAAAQELLFRSTLEQAGVFPGEVSYVEMHGTGTQIGDPAEMTAVANVFSGPLAVGSIKANIGHSEAVSDPSPPAGWPRRNQADRREIHRLLACRRC